MVLPKAETICAIVDDDNPETLDSTLKAGKSLVLFMADWCAPCQMLLDTLTASDDFKAYLARDKVAVYYVDTDQNNQVAMHYRILAIPVIHVYDRGMKKGQIIGNASASTLKAQIETAYLQS